MAQTADTTYFTILTTDRQSGLSKTWIGTDGWRGSYMTFNDRGRGPDLSTRYKQNENGFPVSISRNDYMKNKASEIFEWKDNMARWDNGAEKEEVKVVIPLTY